MKGNSIQKIFQLISEYSQQKGFSSRGERRAFNAIRDCRTGVYGKHLVSCTQGCSQEIRNHSCHHRFCPQCNALPRERWLEEQQQRLLKCGHHHVIFTIPSELRRYWCYHKEEVTSDLFYAAKEAIIRLCKDKQYMEALPGLLLAFHSWSRTMDIHPHIHCLASTEGITEQGEWKCAVRECFLPWKLLMKTYRALLLKRWIKRARKGGWSEALGDSVEIERALKREYKRDWHVEVCPRYRNGRGIAIYLARYMRGGACHPRQVVEKEDGRVMYYPKKGDRKVPVGVYSKEDFVERYLEHVPPHGLRVVRRYGVYASQGHAVKLRDESRPVERREKRALPEWFIRPERCCEHCGEVLVSRLVVMGGCGPPLFLEDHG